MRMEEITGLTRRQEEFLSEKMREFLGERLINEALSISKRMSKESILKTVRWAAALKLMRMVEHNKEDVNKEIEEIKEFFNLDISEIQEIVKIAIRESLKGRCFIYGPGQYGRIENALVIMDEFNLPKNIFLNQEFQEASEKAVYTSIEECQFQMVKELQVRFDVSNTCVASIVPKVISDFYKFGDIRDLNRINSVKEEYGIKET